MLRMAALGPDRPQAARARVERSLRKRDLAEGRRKGRLPRALGLQESEGEEHVPLMMCCYFISCVRA